MLKLLMFVAIVAHTVLIVYSTDTSKSKVTHSIATSGASASSRSSHSSGYSGSKINSECDNGKSNKNSKETSDKCTHDNTHKPCKTNEKYVECPDFSCEPKTCDDLGYPQTCAVQDSNATSCPGKPACLCVSGYVRNDFGVCVPKKQCPSCGGDPNAEAGCGIHCGRYCPNYKEKPIDCAKICKVNSCDCKPDFLFDNNIGKCVAPEDCTITCNNPNELYDPCPPFCPAQKCSVDTRLIKCARYPNPGDPECEPSCRCVEGYLRDDEGVCIPKEECLPFCGQNEVPSDCINGGCHGAQTCSEIGKPVICLKLKAGSCIKGCICQDSYYRNDDGICVTADQCPKNTTTTCNAPNEVYDPCPATCPPQRCGVDPKVIKCAPNPELGDPRCEPGCRCVDGYLRNNEEVCVIKEKCPPKCGDNEIYSSCVNGGCYGARKCSEIGRPVICVDLIEGACKGGCICRDKYLRDEDGICIPENQCPNNNETCTGLNEYYDTCPPACYPKTCDEIDLKFKCPPGECKPACRCISDYYRNSQGICVSEEECRSATCNQNEVYDPCPATCPPLECGVNPALILCTPNPKVGDPECEPGCRCADNYLRNNEGICIPKDQCPIECTQPNEEYDPCPINCPPQTCEAIGKVFPCPLIKSDCQGPGACKCKSGFFRNAIDECISKENCLKCSGSNEYYSCGGACDNVCATLKQQNQTNCPIVNKKCNEMCYCKEGYARDANNRCILIEDCPTCELRDCIEAVKKVDVDNSEYLGFLPKRPPP